VGGAAIVSVRRDGVTRVYTTPARREPTILFRELAHVAVSPSGTFLFVAAPQAPAGSTLGPPAGPLLFWPAGGTPRPVVTGRRVLARRIVAWSRDGRYLVVDGVIEGERALWLVDVAAGSVGWLFPTDSPAPDPATSGAAFDDDFIAFGATPGRIVAVIPPDTSWDVLPAGAPSALGPVAWLP
jgi:hypothetical protein